MTTSYETRLRPSLARSLEPIGATMFAAVFYVCLYGELPYHDVSRFAWQVIGGHFVWDIGHIFMQPATLLWHEYLGFGEAAQASQKHISTCATAIGIGIFYALLTSQGIPRWQCILATVLVTSSASLIILAPSSHMKLLAFPFVNAALYTLVIWEQKSARQSSGQLPLFLLGAGLLAIAATFLASALATAPFAGLAVLLVRLRDGASFVRAVLAAVVFGLVCGACFLLLACAGYIVIAGAWPTLHGLTGSVGDKSAMKSMTYSLTASIAREVFGTANNLIEAPQAGSIGRAALAGYIPSMQPYRSVLLTQAVPLLLTLAMIAAIYLRSAYMAIRGVPCLMILAFLCGAQAWSIYWGLNDPEHWFQLTVPTILLFLIGFSQRLKRLILPAWTVIIAAVNIILFAQPYAAYPLLKYKTQISETFGANDLLIAFEAYSGQPSLALIAPTGMQIRYLDSELHETPDPALVFAKLEADAKQAFATHGRVIVFGGVLDPTDWNAPWSELPSLGVTKAKLLDFIYSHFDVGPPATVAEIPAWQLQPKDHGH